MLNNPIFMQMVADEICRVRQAAWLEEAKIDHALRTSQVQSLGPRDRFFVSAGNLLISAGQKLRQRARRLVYSDAHQSGC